MSTQPGNLSMMATGHPHRKEAVLLAFYGYITGQTVNVNGGAYLS